MVTGIMRPGVSIGQGFSSLAISRCGDFNSQNTHRRPQGWWNSGIGSPPSWKCSRLGDTAIQYGPNSGDGSHRGEMEPVPIFYTGHILLWRYLVRFLLEKEGVLPLKAELQADGETPLHSPFSLQLRRDFSFLKCPIHRLSLQLLQHLCGIHLYNALTFCFFVLCLKGHTFLFSCMLLWDFGGGAQTPTKKSAINLSKNVIFLLWKPPSRIPAVSVYFLQFLK